VQYQHVFDTCTSQGYRPTIFTSIGSGSTRACAGVFVQSDLPFLIKHNLLLQSESEPSPASLLYWNTWALAAFDLEAANPLLHPITTKQMWSQPPDAGANSLYGWFSGTTTQGHQVIGHDSYLLGNESMIFRRSDRISFVVLFNRDLDISLAIDGAGNSLSNALSGITDSITSWPTSDLFPLMGIPGFNI